MMGLDPVQDVDDPIGLKTLELFAGADEFNRWMYNAIAPYCKGRLLEIGSGIGNLSQLLLDQGGKVILSDLRSAYCQFLQHRFGDKSNLEGVVQLDLSVPFNIPGDPLLAPGFDTIIALNVVEHIGDDKIAIGNCVRLLRPGGRLVVLVPAFQSLYNALDKGLGHYKRYSRKGLNALLVEQGLEVKHSRYFNSAGILAWWMSGIILRKKSITAGQLNLYNLFLPVFRLIDAFMYRVAGLSVISIGEKKKTESN
jgi:SAM-dependent methyltransferase